LIRLKRINLTREFSLGRIISLIIFDFFAFINSSILVLVITNESLRTFVSFAHWSSGSKIAQSSC
jgi:hypothetical protein